VRENVIVLTINGRLWRLSLRGDELLIDVLRDHLGLTGTKAGCRGGNCGACTVLVDNEPFLGCLTLAVRCQGRAITTIEGLAAGPNLHPLQQAAVDHHAVQCGYCTPGWLLTAKALLDRSPNPTRDEIRFALAGHLCRCTGYQKIEECILAAARGRQQAGGAPLETVALEADLGG
jgi:aerobic-type carbon monoxide dehydrogenase small subunit (CoxS/CutS family)